MVAYSQSDKCSGRENIPGPTTQLVATPETFTGAKVFAASNF